MRVLKAGGLRQSWLYPLISLSDCTQVIFGLLVDTNGIPLGFEVYPGNTFEGKTLSDIEDKMRKKFNVRRFIFVADRGLISKANIKKLSEDNGEFIVGMKLGSLKKMKKEEVYDLNHFEWIHPEELAVYETQYEGSRCLVTGSQKRAERDRKSRASLLAKIGKKLSSKGAKASTFISNNGLQEVCESLR